MDGVRQLEQGAWSRAPPSSQTRWPAALSAWHRGALHPVSARVLGRV